MISPDPATTGNDERGVVEKLVERLAHVSSEETYARLAGYGFARRWLKGGTAADICWENVGYGTRLLASSAQSVAGLTNSSEACELASMDFSSPNVSYQKVDLPNLPYSDNYFDAVVALGVVEYLDHPAVLAGEIKRVLKQDGWLIISAPDKHLHASERNSRARHYRWKRYGPEFREMLEQHFSHVHIFRQAVVAGSLVFRESETVSDVTIEKGQFSTISPSLNTEAPVACFVLAVCSDAEAPNQTDSTPYLLLDADGTVFDEYEDLSDDVELLRREVQQLQETEVQAFRDALAVSQSEIAYLRAQSAHLKAQNKDFESRLRAIENSRTWQLFGPYRRIRTKLSALHKGGNS